MVKTYSYKNGTIYVRNSDKINEQKIHRATENFLKKVIFEQERIVNNGDNGKSRSI